jgi:uncharacterized protein (TIGR03083 family)
MDEAYWAAVRSLRLRIADLLDELRPEEWDAASLCRGWRVRDVAAHVALVPTITTWQMMAVAPRAGFNPHRINTLLARRHGDAPPDHIVTTIRDHAAGRGTAKVLDSRDALFDVIVHSQDIANPLGRDLPVPVEPTRQGLQRVWDMGWPFNARRRLAGVALRATDTDWTAGSGREVSGTALSLLLLLTGRTSTAVGHLHGPGVARLSA